MGGSVNLQGGGQYQMPGANYAGMQGSVNAPQTADQYAATIAARQPAQTGPRGPISFNPFTGEPDYSYDPGIGADTTNPWTGTPAPVQNPYYAYGNQTAPMMTASEATGYAPMNLPGMNLARPQFYYPGIAAQMAGLQGMGAYGGYGTSMGGKGMQTSPFGFGAGYMGMPGYFSGLGAAGAYMPMARRSYPTYQNPYPALSPVAAYQPRPPSGPTTAGAGTSTGGKGAQTSAPTQAASNDPYVRFRNDPTAIFPSAPATPAAPTTSTTPPPPAYNPNLSPVAPPVLTAPTPVRPIIQPTYPQTELPPEPTLTYERPTPPVIEPTYPQTELPPEPTSFDPLAGGGLLGGYTMPDMRLPGGGVNPDLFVPGGPIATAPQPEQTVYEEFRPTSGIERGFGETDTRYMEP